MDCVGGVVNIGDFVFFVGWEVFVLVLFFVVGFVFVVLGILGVWIIYIVGILVVVVFVGVVGEVGVVLCIWGVFEVGHVWDELVVIGYFGLGVGI